MSVQDYIETDQEKIRRIMQKYDLSKDEDVLALFSALQSGEIEFASAAGREFDDRSYEKATASKAGITLWASAMERALSIHFLILISFQPVQF